MGLGGKFGFPPQRSGSAFFFCCFTWENRCQKSAQGRGWSRRGEALGTWQLGKACAAPFSAHTKRGAGSWLHHCPPVIDMVGGGHLSSLNSNLARVPEIRALWGAPAPGQCLTHSGASGITAPSLTPPLGSFLAISRMSDFK